jgi:hypothetical protein
MTSEKAVLSKIVTYLKTRPETWVFKTHGSPMQVAGVPDLIGVCQGRFFGLEVKRPDGKATPLQEAVMRKIQAAGGLVGVVRSVEDAAETLDAAPPAGRGGGTNDGG